MRLQDSHLRAIYYSILCLNLFITVESHQMSFTLTRLIVRKKISAVFFDPPRLTTSIASRPRYRKAAEQGLAEAQFNLGVAYAEGKGDARRCRGGEMVSQGRRAGAC